MLVIFFSFVRRLSTLSIISLHRLPFYFFLPCFLIFLIMISKNFLYTFSLSSNSFFWKNLSFTFSSDFLYLTCAQVAYLYYSSVALHLLWIQFSLCIVFCRAIVLFTSSVPPSVLFLLPVSPLSLLWPFQVLWNLLSLLLSFKSHCYPSK